MRWFLNLIQRKRIHRDIAEEMASHIEERLADLRESGISEKEALAQARREFGNATLYTEISREGWGWTWLDSLGQDIRYACRVLWKSKAFTVVSIIILSLGIGANTAIVSTMDAVVFRPLPFPQPDRLVVIRSGTSLPDYLDIRKNGGPFSGIASFSGLPLFAHVGSEALYGRSVSANFFDVLGLTMAAGRDFLPEEEAGSHPVVVISYRYWQRRYGGDSSVLGKTVKPNGVPLTVVGVAPRGFRDGGFRDVSVTGRHMDLWVPILVFGKVMRMEGTREWKGAPDDRGTRWLGAIGRLEPGVTLTQANARMDVVFGNLKRAYPELHANWNPTLLPANRTRWPRGNMLFSSAVLLASGICLLLIACTNIASLLLARGFTRQKEIATRLALGAGRRRVVRQLLVEGLTLSALALIGSLLVCSLTLRILPVLEGPLGTPILVDLTLDHRTFIFAVCIALLTTLTFGMYPSLVATRIQLTDALRNQGFTAAVRSRTWSLRVLIVSQILLSVVLLIAAGLFARTILHYGAIDSGFDRNVLLIRADFLSHGFDRDKGLAFYRQSLPRVRELPGIRHASWAEDLPFERGQMNKGIRKEHASNTDEWLVVDCNSISPGYFATLGIPMPRGRDFTDHDVANSAAVVIINETLARRYWPDTVPLGKRIRVKGGDPELYEVIGVAKDVKDRTPWEQRKPYAYFPYWHLNFYFHMDLHVSSLGDPLSMVEPIRKACAAANPNITLEDPRLISEQLKSLMSHERAAAFVLTIFGSLSLVLAAVGLYGIISYSVSQRTREFGIRMAVGAGNGDIIRLVVSEGMTLVLAGIGIGLVGSMVLTRLIASRLHGLSATDPTTYAGIAILCVFVAVPAVFLPARMATANVMDAVRSE